MDYIRILYRHMEWADARAWAMTLNLQQADEDARLRETLHHIHLVQYAWLQIWTRLKPDYPEVTDFEDLEAIARWGRTHHQEIKSFLKTIAPQALQEKVELPAWSEQIEKEMGVPPQPATLAETLLQIPLHTAHHRGQVMTRLRELGEKPETADFIWWAWLGKPATEWPLT